MKNLFENNTGKLVKQLAAKDLRADKRRNIFIISTIAFAVCLMVTLALFFLGSSHELKKQLQGRYQAVVIGMSKEEITKAMNDKSLAKVGVEVGINILHIDKFTLNVNYRDKNDVNLRSISIQGQLPKKENEILISRTYLEKIGINPEIGRQVKLSLDETTEKNFTITGIIDDKENRNAYEVIVSESYLQTYYTSTIPYKVLVRYGDSKDIKPDELKTMITYPPVMEICPVIPSVKSIRYTLSITGDLESIMDECLKLPDFAISGEWFGKFWSTVGCSLLFLLGGIILLFIMVASSLSIISSGFQRILKPLMILPFAGIAIALGAGGHDISRSLLTYIKTFFGFCISGALMVVAVKGGIALCTNLVSFDLSSASEIQKCILMTVQMSVTPIVISGLVKGSDAVTSRMF